MTTITNRSALTCPTTYNVWLEHGSRWDDGCSLLSLALFCLCVLCGTGKEFDGQSMGEDL